VRLARAEATTLLRAVGTGTVAVAVGGVLGLLGTLCLLAGLIMLVGDQWLQDKYWLAALVVALIAGAIAAFFALRGRQRLSAEQLAPRQTVETIKEDVEWLRHRRT
jgi:drug/metabolite transporter (DMT)-like permease